MIDHYEYHGLKVLDAGTYQRESRREQDYRQWVAAQGDTAVLRYAMHAAEIGQRRDKARLDSVKAGVPVGAVFRRALQAGRLRVEVRDAAHKSRTFDLNLTGVSELLPRITPCRR